MRMLIGLACLALLLMLAYHFFSPEKDLVTGTPLRLRIKTQALLRAVGEEATKSYKNVSQAKQDERIAVVERGAQHVWRKFQETYKRHAFLDYLNELKTMTAGLLATFRQEAAVIAGGDAAKINQSTPTSLYDFSRAVRTWLEINEKRLHALSGVDADDLEAKVRDELIKLQGDLRAACEEFEKRVSEMPDTRKGYASGAYRKPTPTETKAAGSSEEVPNASSDERVVPAPQDVLDAFRQRYLNRDLRKTPYYFKDLKIIKSACGLAPGIYCISFSAEVYHNHDNKRWDKSPVVLNVIAKVGSDGVMSTYENFAKNPWDYPVSGSCVKPLWGVHEYVWERVCPYRCMGR